MTNSKDVILTLKKVKKERNLSLNTILQMIEDNNEFVSKGFGLPYKQIMESPNTSFSFERVIVLDKVDTIKLGEIASFSLGIKTSDGFWSFGSVGGETLCLSYDTDTNYTNNN